MRYLVTKSGLTALVALGVVGLPNLASAAAAAASSSDGATAIDELVVTAMKREQSVLSVPASITAVGAQVLQQRGITNVNDLQFAVPGLQASTGTGTEGSTSAIVIRGVGLGPTGTQGVAEYVDGIYQPTAALGDLAQIDVARVEVLRGPQGTLYGRNANAGAVNFISNAPTSELGGSIQATLQNYNEQKLQVVLNAPLSDRVKSRLVFSYDNRQEGFVKNLVPGNQDLDRGRNIAGRLRVDADLTENLKLDVNLAFARTNGPYLYGVERYTNPLAVAANPIVGLIFAPTKPWTTTAGDPTSTNRRFELAGATLSWTTPIGDLKSVTAYQNFRDDSTSDVDTSAISYFPGEFATRHKTFTEEINLTSKIGPVDSVVGAFYMNDNARKLNLFHEPLGYAGVIPPGGAYIGEVPKYRTIASAAYADATWNVSDRLRVLGGVRYSTEKQDVDYNTRLDLTHGTILDLCPASPTFPPPGVVPLESVGLDYSKVTSRGGVQYDVAEHQNLYATVSQGFKAGGVNTAICGGAGNTFKPETILSYEGGYKARLFDGRLSLAVSAFYYDYTNFQLVQSGVGLVSLITNASSARIKGVEFESTWNLDKHWTLSGNGSFLSARYHRYLSNDDFNPAGVGLPASACVAGSTTTNCIQDFSGKLLSTAPKVSLNAGVAYQSDDYSWGNIVARADVSYRSRTYYRPSNELRDSQAPYTITNLALIWNSPEDKYAVRLFGQNVGNVDYIGYPGSNGTIRALSYHWGNPRQYGVELKAKF